MLVNPCELPVSKNYVLPPTISNSFFINNYQNMLLHISFSTVNEELKDQRIFPSFTGGGVITSCILHFAKCHFRKLKYSCQTNWKGGSWKQNFKLHKQPAKELPFSWELCSVMLCSPRCYKESHKLLLTALEPSTSQERMIAQVLWH